MGKTLKLTKLKQLERVVLAHLLVRRRELLDIKKIPTSFSKKTKSCGLPSKNFTEYLTHWIRVFCLSGVKKATKGTSTLLMLLLWMSLRRTRIELKLSTQVWKCSSAAITKALTVYSGSHK